MVKTVGYMLTWTTYGTWLQGSEFGYVNKGRVYRENPALENANMKRLRKEPVFLSLEEKTIVKETLLAESERQGHQIYAIAVCSDHVHLVGGFISTPIEKLVWAYKFASARALNERGLQGKVS